jgi:hypothetical protein
MSEIIKCDECGGLFNQRHLSSHKRLSHNRKKIFPAAAAREREAVETILAVFKRLSGKARKDVLNRLNDAVNSI